MIQPFDFHLPTRISWRVPAADAAPEAAASVGARRVLIVTDPGIDATGIVERIQSALEAAGVSVAKFADVGSNPTTRHVSVAREMATNLGADALLAVGGGSSIDTAKAAAMLLSNGGEYSDYQWDGRPINQQSHPLITIPTTAGTGSEVTKVAVISDETEPFKKGVLSPLMYARVAIIDPELTVGLPAGLTAATGIDAFIHALEAFTGLRTNPVSDMMAVESLKLCWHNLGTATHNGSNIEARSQMMLAALFGGMAMDQSGLGLVHALSGGVCSHLHLHHGLANASLLPTVFEFNVGHLDRTRRDTLAGIFGLSSTVDDDAMAEAVTDYVRSLDLPINLTDHRESLDANSIDSIAAESMRMVMVHNNPRPVDAEICRALIESMT